MKVINIREHNIPKKTISMLTSLGIVACLGSCKLDDDKLKYKKTDNYSLKIINTNGYSKGYAKVNNGYKMKVLTIDSNDKKENLIGYFDITEEINFTDIVNNKTYNLSSIVRDSNINIYVSDISQYIDINKNGIGLNSIIVASLYEDINNEFTIKKEKSEFQISYKLNFSNNSILLTNITENIIKYTIDEISKNTIDNITMKR